MKKTHFTELSVVTAIECLNEVYYDEIVCNILISNLNLIDQHGIKVSNALKEKLSNFISNYLKNYSTFVDLEMGDFSQVERLISLLLEFQDSPDRYKTAETILPSLQTSCDKILQSSSARNDSIELEKLIKYFRIIETLLKCVSNVERNSKIYCILITLEDLLSKAFLIRNRSVLVYSFSLLSAYYHIVSETRLVYKIWSQAVANLLKDRSYCEFYLITVSYLIGCSFSIKELYEILNTDEFWTALQLCLEDDHCIQKHALHVLKYASFNLCGEPQSCKLNHSNVFDCAHSKEYSSWWKTFFVIMENLDEKQTHLVLPTFSLVNSLIDNKIVSNDKFWILRLLENGLKHDSRTVRIEALLFLLDVNVSSFNKHHTRYVVRIMLTALNDSYLFRKAFKLNKFHHIENSFAKCIVNFSSQQLKLFYKMLIQLKWSPVPLFYCLKSITQCRRNFQCLDTESIRMSGGLIQNIVRFHNIKIRAAIQSLFIELVLMLSEKNSDTAIQIITSVSNFNDEECLQRNTTSWRLIAEYLRQSSSYQDFELYMIQHTSTKIDGDDSLSDSLACFFARVAVLFEDAFSPKNHHIRIAQWISSFENVLHKPYMNRTVQNNRLKFIVYLLKTERSCLYTSNSEGSMRYYSLAENHFMHLFTYIVNSLMNCNNFDRIEFYESSLTEISYLFEKEFPSLMNISILQDWLLKSSEGLRSESIHVRYSSLKIVSWIYYLIYRYPKLHMNIDKWKTTLATTTIDYINNFNLRSVNIEEINGSGATGAGKLYSRFLNNLWSMMELYLLFEKENVFPYVDISSLFDLILDTLDLARKENLTYIFKFLKVLLSMEVALKYETIVLNLMSICWKLVEETSATSFYSDSLKYWIQAFCQESLLSEKTYQTKLIWYVNELLEKVAEDGGQSYHSMVLILKEFDRVSNLFLRFPDVVLILINIFSVTHINRKDQRIENETIEYIKGLGDSISVNQITKFDFIDSAEEMRLIALNMLLKLHKQKIGDEKWTKIMNLLIPSDGLIKKRYFNDSVIHRTKHRKLQLLLIFETILFNETSSSNENRYSDKLFQFAVNSVLLEPHQPSVRYMLEWLLIRLIINFGDQLEDKFWKCFLGASEERIGSICSFISIGFHLANIRRTESITEMAIKSILPWTMAQHFNARLYAQTVVAKLVNINNSVSEKYEIIRQSLENSLKTGNAVKNAVKLQNDFYFSYFHPMEHFSLETILWDLPRLSNICKEEWISVDRCETLVTCMNETIPIRNRNTDFANFTSSSWIAKATSVTHDDEKYSNEESAILSLQESQKKFIPQTDLLDGAPASASLKKDDNLIVVASLIDRAPNLGGLTRTCEIFAVSALIVNNLEITRHKEYTSLSITAEKHVQINEVKRYNLFAYLKNKKEEGYCIIGAEQTTNSKNLSEFLFPKKSVLLLGNEKEGIPANLLCLLDMCVEIPQKGVIRSLNVHVSASLFIWEYAKQHVFGN